MQLRCARVVTYPPDRSLGSIQMARSSGGKMSIFGELWSFMKVRKKWWLGPIVVTMLMLSVLIVLTEGSAVAPFIYALF
jgi:hypothetical protein